MAADMQVHEPDALITPERRAQAEQRAERIVSYLAGAATEIAQAILAEDWTALGLSQEQWRARLFGDRRLTVEARRQVHELLSAEGMSERRISEATGTPRSTVQHDLGNAASPDVTRVAQNGPPPPDQRERHETSRRPKPAAERSPGYRDRHRTGQEARRPSGYEPPAGPGPVAQPCPRCAHLEEELSTLRALVAETGHDPAAVEDVYREVRRLRTRVRELKLARGSAGQIGPGRPDPGREPQRPGRPADSAHAEGQAAPEPGARRYCGSAYATRMRVTLPDGREAEKWLCGHHAELVAGSGAEVTAVLPAEGEDVWDEMLREEPCEYPLAAQVPA